MSQQRKRPERVPADHDDGHHFTTEVMPGIPGGHGKPDQAVATAENRKRRPRRPELSIDAHVEGVLSGDRSRFARTITLVESISPEHRARAEAVLAQCLPHTGRSIRVGISGVPGAGKSTFIEALGMLLCNRGHKVAVLAVDPTSSRTGGSILGDKTRMEQLAREPNAFIRPSPSGGTLGGVAGKTRETLLLCEAAGYDVILVETVGVGQSEVSVRSMVDFFLVLQIAGAGDELQGIKKGIIELADAIVVNKADGDNVTRARTTAGEYNRVLHFLQPATPGWRPRAVTCSALHGEGVEAVWALFEEYLHLTQENGAFDRRRAAQAVEWLHSLIEEALLEHFKRDADIAAALPEVERAVAEGRQPVTQAALELVGRYFGGTASTGSP